MDWSFIKNKNDKKSREEIVNENGGSKSGRTEPDGLNDIYNSMPEPKTAEPGKRILKNLKIPFISAVVLISAIITFKAIFNAKQKNTPQNNLKKNENRGVIPMKQKFSPSVFAEEKKTKNIKRSKKFASQFAKETKIMRGNIKFSSNKKYPASQTPEENKFITDKKPNISGKMIVFIKESYGKNILEEEKGKSGVSKKITAVQANGEIKKVSTGARILIPQGAVVNAYTRYKIFSYDTSVPVIAVLLDNYYRNGKLILKKGDKFFGTVSARHSLDRLNMNFEKIIKLSGKSINIDAIAMMPDGSGGVKGIEHHNYGKNILVSIASGIAGAASIFAGGGSAIESSNPYSFQNQVRENVARNEIGEAQNGLNSYAASEKNEAITLPAHTSVKIIFLKSLYKLNKFNSGTND